MTLTDFLDDINTQQTLAYSELAIFNPEHTVDWDKHKRKYFVQVFYHTRGHFDRLLWMRLVHASNEGDKRKILEYMAEEAGLTENGNQDSHEVLFGRFAKSVGVDLTAEVTERIGYEPFARQFNRGLIDWFTTNDPESNEAAFAAYEKLDNVDYGFLYRLAESFDLPQQAMEYFEVHRDADHFEKTSGGLPEIWQRDQEIVTEAFNYVYKHQEEMWVSLNDAMRFSPED